MKILNVFILILCLIPLGIHGQVGINTTTPNAALEVKSSNQSAPLSTDGIIIPKIDEYPSTNPSASQDGMLVYVTGDGSVDKGFYYWDNGSSTWRSFGGEIERLDDLVDARSDNDGTDDGSSIFIGVNAGIDDDGSDNKNVAIGYDAFTNNTAGFNNTSIGYRSLNENIIGSFNTALGSGSLANLSTGENNTAIGSSALLLNHTGESNVAIGTQAGFYSRIGSQNVFIGAFSGNNPLETSINGSVFIGFGAGFGETEDNRLHITNFGGTPSLIYGEFDNNLLRVNGTTEVVQTADSSLKVKTDDGNSSSISLIEGADFGFEFLYTGSNDKLNLWSRTFSGNEAERMTWLKDGRVGINDNEPSAMLDIEASNVSNPRNTDGILIPRIDAFPSTNPTADQNGLLVFSNSDNQFYYWNHNLSNWQNFSGADRLDNLIDAKSDNDGSDDGSSVFIGIDAGLNDDQSNNRNIGLGFHAILNNTTGRDNVAIGYGAMLNNISGLNNTALGFIALQENTIGNNNVAIGDNAGRNTDGNDNIFIGVESGSGGMDSKSGSVFIGHRSGIGESNSDRLYIENSGSSNPLIYGEFDNDLLRVNGITEVVQTTDSSLKVKTNDGNSSSLSLFEGADFGFEFLYTGSDDKLNLWSRNFSGNEAERMTWLKDGRIGINDNEPNALLDIEASNPVTPRSVDGILIPRINAFPTTNPTIAQNGMLVYLNSDSNFYHWHNASNSWRILGGPQGVDDLYDGVSEASGSSVYVGLGAGFNNSSNARNSGFGFNVLSNNIGGFFNSGVGHRSLVNNTTGDSNTSIGFEALENVTTGSRNTAIGANSGPTIGGLSNTTAVGYNTVPLFSNSVRIGNASVTSIGGHANWSNVSDKRLKTNIQENIVGLKFINQLRPVSYNLDMEAIARYEKTPDSLRLKDAEALKAKEIQTGFIAQEVEAAAKASNFDFHGVVRFGDDGLYGLNYSEFVVPLVKAVQEQQELIELQHQQIKSQQEEINQLKQDIQAIKASLQSNN